MADPQHTDPGAPEGGTQVPQVSESQHRRMSQSARGMLVSLGLLVAIVLVVAGLTVGFSFSPGGPRVDPDAGPRVDTANELGNMARAAPIPLRDPGVPSTWHANSLRSSSIDGALAVRVGYVTADGGYIALWQTGAGLTALSSKLGAAPGAGRSSPPAPDAQGGWQHTTGSEGMRVWLHADGQASWALAGDARRQQFQLLSESLSAAAPLPS